MKFLKNKNVRAIFSPLLAGIILAALGLGLIIFSQGKNVKAGSQEYHMIWNIHKIPNTNTVDGAMTASSVYASRTATIPIGVTKWTVSGDYGGKYFTEKWYTPSYSNSLFNNPPSSTDWLYGYFRARNTNNDTMGLSIDTNSNSTGYGTRTTENYIQGDAIRCNDNDCLIATGPYSFTFGHNVQDSTYKPFAAVTMIPLMWTVEGKLCDTLDECKPE